MKRRPRVVIIGAGGHGRVIRDVLRLQGRAEAAGFVDDDPGLQAKTVDGLPVLGTTGDLFDLRRRIDAFVAAIGDNSIRAQKFAEANRGWPRSLGCRPSLEHK